MVTFTFVFLYMVFEKPFSIRLTCAAENRFSARRKPGCSPGRAVVPSTMRRGRGPGPVPSRGRGPGSPPGVAALRALPVREAAAAAAGEAAEEEEEGAHHVAGHHSGHGPGRPGAGGPRRGRPTRRDRRTRRVRPALRTRTARTARGLDLRVRGVGSRRLRAAHGLRPGGPGPGPARGRGRGPGSTGGVLSNGPSASGRARPATTLLARDQGEDSK